MTVRRDSMEARIGPWPLLTRVIRPWMVVGLAAALYGLVILAQNDMDPMAFVKLGTRFAQQ